MKKIFLLGGIILLLLYSCKKNDTTPTPPENKENILSDKTIIVSSDVINSSLIAVDSTKLTFTATGSGVDKVKVGSILVSDISTIAPIGFLRKVTGISTVAGNKVCTTEQASLTDAIVKGKVTYNRTFTDSDITGDDSSGIDVSAQQRVHALSFTFNYNKVIYDADGNNSTSQDQVKINGEMKIEPSFDFELDIDGSRVKKFITKITLKNTNKISAETKAVLASLNVEIVLKTFDLKPFTVIVAGVPIPIAKQWIAIVLGVDGRLTARVTAGAQNINTAVAGISYENNSWSTINTQENSFTLLPLTFEGAAKVEPWLQVRYEIRPYGIKQSRIYLGVRGSIIGEASVIPTGLNTTLKWGVKFSAKAQMQIWDIAILNYELVFFEREYPISQSNAIASLTIGSQIWALKNLDVTTYRNGDPIPQVTDATQWTNLTTGAWCYYNNDPANGPIYGKLYNWYAVNDPRGLAPTGWHVPSHAEWTTLSTFLGGDAVAGSAMRETGTAHWMSPNTGATNSSGFTALPGGFRFNNGPFSNIGFDGLWWSSTELITGIAQARSLNYDVAYLGQGGNDEKVGFSVRCVRD